MTTAGSALRLSLRKCWFPSTSRLVTAPRHTRTTQQRTFTTTQLACARYNSNEGRAAKGGPYQHLEDAFKDLSPEQLKQLEGLVSEHEDTGEPTTFTETLRANEEEPEARRMADPFEKRLKGFQNSLKIRPEPMSMWSDPSDEEAIAEMDVDEFKEDDMTSMAHGKLDEIREWRHYARIAAWEMPLLSKLAKPFSPPAANQPLRFRYTTYMGEFHPAEKKVVVEFSPADMGLTPVQTDKLKKLVGPRYNPDKDVIKMSCESFGQPAQNKRYLSDLVDTLVEQAKDPKDTFEDIPLDTRHHITKGKPRFPKEWRMTPERQAELEGIRQAAARLDAGKELEGRLVSGLKSIDMLLNPPVVEGKAEAKDPVAELVAAPRSGKGGKAMRR